MGYLKYAIARPLIAVRVVRAGREKPEDVPCHEALLPAADKSAALNRPPRSSANIVTRAPSVSRCPACSGRAGRRVRRESASVTRAHRDPLVRGPVPKVGDRWLARLREPDGERHARQVHHRTRRQLPRPAFHGHAVAPNAEERPG